MDGNEDHNADGPSYRDLILSFAASFTLADHMGEVYDDVICLLKEIDFVVPWGENLRDMLADMGVKTLWGTSLEREPEDGE